MNTRIQELAKELGPVATIGNWGRIEWADNVYPQLGDKMYASIDLEKFAELIVKECAEIADNADATREKWQSIGKFVKEHFGVEE
jgi:hypothetical protein